MPLVVVLMGQVRMGGMCVTVKSAVRLDVVFGVRHERSYVSMAMATALCRMDRAMRWATAHPG